ncbi:uncharacterized protein LOC115438142 isoform X3 [Sphaeramia orbicularis]|uniref:uncharacterized protein LOC115438142 isoform X3 n=1 Tax=Sphaeramia orbicularis TaxID=375764 RepID=UPI00117EF370|nr:uncharacterized protein LOC115438142 isoform X3 [Sphaeramia orbicularis]
MKLRSYLVFLVLALVCISRGDDEATTAPENRPEVSQTHTDPPPTSAASTPSESVNKSTYEVTPATTPSTSPEENTTDAWYFTNNITNELTNETGEEGSGSSSSSSSSSTVPQTTTPGGTTPLPAPDQSQHHTSWGYVILVLIIVVVVVLCVILYLLRRVSRTYSFDLQRPSPAHNLSEPIGTFEPVYLDDLDRPALKDQVNSNEPSTPSTANGTRLQAEEKSSNGDVTCSSLPFVEINLEEAPWCDQLLSSPQAPSSVLPFPPFSFSSSS